MRWLRLRLEGGAGDERVGKVFICTPDKDLSQCVVGTRVVQMDRRKNEVRDEAGVVEKFGVRPESIPDYLAVVGDSADGFPGVKGWGAKGAAGGAVAVSAFGGDTEGLAGVGCVGFAGRGKLAESLFAAWDDALLFRRLATLRIDAPVFESVEELRWKGPGAGFEGFCRRIKAEGIFRRAVAAMDKIPQ